MNVNIGQAFPANYWVTMPNKPSHHNYIIQPDEVDNKINSEKV